MKTDEDVGKPGFSLRYWSVPVPVIRKSYLNLVIIIFLDCEICIFSRMRNQMNYFSFF